MMMIDSLALFGARGVSLWHWRCKDSSAKMPGAMQALDLTDLVVFILVELFGLRSALCWPSVVMMGFRSWPFRLFFPPFPLVALFAALATCLALFMAAFLISFPFMVMYLAQSRSARNARGKGGGAVLLPS